MIGSILGIIIVALIVFPPLFCLIKGIRLLISAIKDKENRKSKVKRGILNICVFLCFIIGFMIFDYGISRSIVASM